MLYIRQFQQPLVQVRPTNEETLRIVFLHIGQGDASLIHFPSGETMLIDCAKDAVVLEALGRYLTPWQRTIDHLIVTNPDLDHYGGCIDVIRRFEVKHIYHSGFPKKGPMWQQFLLAAQDEVRTDGAVLNTVSTTFTFLIGDVSVHFLYPDHDISFDARVPRSTEKPSSNNASIVTKISFGEQDVLFPGDGEHALEQYLVDERDLDVEVLKLGHHGSGSSSIIPFLQETSPLHAVVSAGAGNAYGHPHERVLRRVERTGAQLWRTDTDGDILVTITKDHIGVEARK